MIFRIYTYQVVPGKVKAFNEFLLTRLLPVQKGFGARLVGRFQTNDGLQIAVNFGYLTASHLAERE